MDGNEAIAHVTGHRFRVSRCKVPVGRNGSVSQSRFLFVSNGKQQFVREEWGCDRILRLVLGVACTPAVTATYPDSGVTCKSNLASHLTASPVGQLALALAVREQDSAVATVLRDEIVVVGSGVPSVSGPVGPPMSAPSPDVPKKKRYDEYITSPPPASGVFAGRSFLRY